MALTTHSSLQLSAPELALLDPATTRQLIDLADKTDTRAHRLDMLGMVCGTVSFLGCVGIFYLLVMQQHYTSAGVVLGTSVLSIIQRMIKPR